MADRRVFDEGRVQSLTESLLIEADACQALQQLPAESVQCCVTSPPYWSLRDYDSPDQIGLEPTIERFIERLVVVFREVKRVLRDNGVLWLNIGDAYTSGDRGYRAPDKKNPVRGMSYRPQTPKGLKPKDLIGIPWRLAFALQQDGWYLRSDCVWEKPNCMPESVKDRPTRAHEYMFLLSKSESYFYNHEAVKGPNGRNLRSVWSIPTQPFNGAHFACVDAETECLTAEGWKRHDELRPGELAAQYDIETQTLSWGTIEIVARYDVVDQEMVLGRRRDLDMILTPNHRCVVRRRHSKTRKLLAPGIIRADTLKPSHAIPTAGKWDFTGDATVPLEWAELLGWYIAEGHESQQSLAVEIYQSDTANPEKVERIELLLRQVGAEWTAARATRMWRGRETVAVAFRITGYAALRLREMAPRKRIPHGALLWAEGRTGALMRGLIGGDGHTRSDDNRTVFVQKDEVQAGMVQALAMRLGWSANMTKRPDGVCTVYLTKHTTRSFRGTAGEGSPLERVHYTGIVWCPKLPRGTWVARRNGKPFITGNTFPPALIEPCILAGSRVGDFVLDPFFGSGTVGVVCDALDRRYIGIELNPEYVEIASRRLSNLFSQPTRIVCVAGQ